VAAPPRRKLKIQLPSYRKGDNDVSYLTNILEALEPLDADPRSVAMTSEYFNYTDDWQGENRLQAAIDFLGDVEPSSQSEVQSTLGEMRTHLNAVRSLIREHGGRRGSDILHAKSDFCMNVLALRGLVIRSKRRSRNRTPRRADEPAINVTEAKRYSHILIDAFQEALDYTPRQGSNQPQPALWLDDKPYLEAISRSYSAQWWSPTDLARWRDEHVRYRGVYFAA
jgi:hypothetical protein